MVNNDDHDRQAQTRDGIKLSLMALGLGAFTLAAIIIGVTFR